MKSLHYFRKLAMDENLQYQIALKKLGGVGVNRAKKLVSFAGGVKELFELSDKKLALIPGITKGLINRLERSEALRQAEQELKFIEKRQLKTIFYLDDAYPNRLKYCDDGPILLYTLGAMQLNKPHVVSIVGTRDFTDYGLKITERLVEALKPYDPLIVSGLAYGIDTIAHRSAVQHGLQTVGVLGNSLDRIYPDTNESLARKMIEHGGLLSEFESGTKPDRTNFPQRNRIVAGMADVTIVIESGVKGGSMITARQAASYNRDVAAFPGPIDAPFSAGCNYLIKTNQAALIENCDDLIYLMGWQLEEKKMAAQKQLFVDLNPEEMVMMAAFKDNQKQSLDGLSLKCDWAVSKTSSLLLELEFKGLIKSLPGKMYALT